ncbi:MAG: DUF58 domain-containing protein [Proteobacteria bacterium]|nr:MAG: DUF58 domain-containing protein [Pseudomonadota bacterium]
MKPKSYLSGKTFILLGAWQFLGASALLYPPLLWAYGAIFLLIFFVLLRDRKSIPELRQWTVNFKGVTTLRLREKKTWIWELSTGGANDLQSIEFYFPSCSLFKNDKKFSGYPKPFESLVIAQHVTGHRLGTETLPSPFVLVVSRWGLWKQLVELPFQSVELQCKPSLEPVPPEHLGAALQRLQSLLLGSKHLIKLRSRDQFHSLREYRHQDEIRNIDPRKSAKRGELMIREYDSLVKHHLVIGLDLGRSLSGEIAGSEKSNYYLEGVYSLLQKAIASHDQVSFFAFHQEIVTVHRKIQNLQGIRQILEQGNRLRATDVESNYNLISSAMTQIDSQRCIVLILSDIARPSVQSELQKAMQPIAAKHLSLVMGILEKEADIRQNQPVPKPGDLDAWSQDSYIYWLDEEFHKFTQRMLQIRSGALLCPEQYWLDMSSKLYMRLRDSLLI